MAPSGQESGRGVTVFDRATLDANTMADRALQQELFDLYFDQARMLLDTMAEGVAEAADASSPPEALGAATRRWRECAHGLKGTARTLGLLRLGESASDAETGRPCSAALRRLRGDLTQAMAEANAYLASTASAA